MGNFKKQLKEDGIIFIHNFFTVAFTLIGYDILQRDDLLSRLIGCILFSYGCYLGITALYKGTKEFLDVYDINLNKKTKN